MSVDRSAIVPETLLQALPGRVRVADLTGRVTQRNTSARTFDEKNAPGVANTLRALWDHHAPCSHGSNEPLPYLQSPAMRALGGRVVKREFIRVGCDSKKTMDLYVYASPLRDGADVVTGVLQIDEDVEPILGVQNELSGFARVGHDLNNALNPIMAASFLLKHHASSPELVVTYAETIAVAAERCATIVADVVGRPTKEEPIRSSLSSEYSAGKTRRILLAEDQEDVRNSLCRVLERAGYDCHAVATVADVRGELAASSTGPYDLLLTDIGFPDGSGWEVVEFAGTNNPGIPVVCAERRRCASS